MSREKFIRQLENKAEEISHVPRKPLNASRPDA
jgi:hypothetical protein